ncbi:MAG: hypothetical protein ABIR71_11210 [Chthoniobacterales bacterium]
MRVPTDRPAFLPPAARRFQSPLRKGPLLSATNQNQTAFLAFSAAALLLASAAFAGGLKKEIVGKWADADGVESIEYKADGTFTETMAGGDVIEGKYTFPDDQSIKVEFEGPMSAAGAVASPITIKGDEMSVTGVDGSSVMTYARQK